MTSEEANKKLHKNAVCKGEGETGQLQGGMLPGSDS